jgi:hypothetical protein
MNRLLTRVIYLALDTRHNHSSLGREAFPGGAYWTRRPNSAFIGLGLDRR